jgi:3-hydroxyisobutyrate dehydrogenase-like beta-hydroxyacid dehydrogenase
MVSGKSRCSCASDRPAALRRVGMIGLGLMGTAFTERLLEGGYEVHIWNRTREKAAPLTARGARWCENPLTVCDRVLISLYTTDAVKEVLAQMDDGLRPGRILIDTTTGSPDPTARLGARLAERGVQYLDAPFSGSSEQTRRGEATAIVGGSRETFEACQDLFDCCAGKTLYVGPCGSGSRMKLVSNLVLGLNRAALAEGLVFARALGLELNATLEVLNHSMAYSRTMDTKGRKMIEGDFSVQARLLQHLKDIRLILEVAAEKGQALPLSEAHRELLEAAEAAGFGDADNSAVIRAYPLPHHTAPAKTCGVRGSAETRGQKTDISGDSDF